MNDFEFKEGQLVKHKIGSIHMMVISCNRDGGEIYYTCRWELKEGFEVDDFSEFELESIEKK